MSHWRKEPKVKVHSSCLMRKATMWFPKRFDTNQAVQLLMMVRGCKFWIKEVEELYYLCSESKVADQLRCYRKVNLHLCFRISSMFVFS